MAEKKTAPSIADVLAKAQKTYGLHLGSLSSVADDVIPLSTGNIAIDHITGIGGLPVGRCIELFGPPSSGKTTTGLQCAAWVQDVIKAGGNEQLGISGDDVIAYFDYEHAMDPKYVKALGLDVDHPSFIFAQPDSLEQGANVARQLLETGKVRLTLWDSVAAMTPAAILEAETGASRPAIQAKLMSDFLKVLVSQLTEFNSTAIFLNHEAEVMEMGGGRRPGMPPRTTTPGGRALKFYASLRVEYRQVANHKGKVLDELSNELVERVVATDVRVRIIKNKVAPPFKQGIVRVRYGRGFDNFWSAMQVLIAHKRVVYSTGYYYFEKSPELVHPEMRIGATKNQRPYIQGETALFDFADEHPEWRSEVIASAARLLKDLREGENLSSEVSVDVDPAQDIEPTDESLENEAQRGVLVVTASGAKGRQTLVNPAKAL